MGLTPIYGFPYQDLGDPPNGPVLGQNLASAVEGELNRVEGRLTNGSVPGARIGTTTRTATFTNITTVETAVDWVTVALVAGRRYRVRFTAAWGSTVAGDTVFTRLRQDSATGTQMTIMRTQIPATGGAGTRWDATVEAEYTAVSTGNKSFYATGVRATGTGLISAQADVTFPIYLYVDYIGG